MNVLQEARTFLRKLGLSGRRFDRGLLLERLESRLGISVSAVPDARLPAGGISGARITTNGSHVVFYPAGASERMQLAVICHECAHLLLNHRSLSAEDVLAGTELPWSDDELAAEALGAALVQFARQPERLRAFVQGADHTAAGEVPAILRSRLRDFYRPRELVE